MSKETAQEWLVANALCILDCARGIYIPRDFADIYGDDVVDKEEYAEDLDILLQGPEHEHYWEAWENILMNAEIISTDGKKYSLWVSDNGDVIAIPSDIPDHIDQDDISEVLP